jgi:hypothetical protein
MEQLSIVQDSFVAFGTDLAHFLPRLIIAIVILLIGWLVAKVLHWLVVKGLKAIHFGVLTTKVGLDGFLKKGGIRQNTSEVLGLVVYWLLMLALILATLQYLGFDDAGTLFTSVGMFIPKVIFAVLILTIGLYLARFVSDAVTAYTRNVGLEDSALVGRVTYYAIATFVVVTALEHIGLPPFMQLFQILWIGIVAAFALAFGLGGRDWAAGILDKLTSKAKNKP